MSASEFILPIFLATLGLGIIGYFAWVTFRAVWSTPRGIFERIKVQRKEQLLRTFDRIAKERNLASALSLLRDSFFLDEIRHSQALIERVNNHHTTILGRLVSLAEARSSHLPNLAIVEDLLLSRALLLRGLLETREILAGARKKKPGGSFSQPKWAEQEFNKKLEDLYDKLATNRRSLEAQLKDLFANLMRVPDPKEVTYH